MTTIPPAPLPDPGPVGRAYVLLAAAVEVRAILGVLGRAVWPWGRQSTVPGALLVSYHGEGAAEPGTLTVGWATTRLGPVSRATVVARLGRRPGHKPSSDLWHQYRKLRVRPGAEAAVGWGMRAAYRLALRQLGETAHPDAELVAEPVHRYRLQARDRAPAVLDMLTWSSGELDRYLELTGATRPDSGGDSVLVCVLDTDLDEKVVGALSGTGFVHSGLDLYVEGPDDAPAEAPKLTASVRRPGWHGTLVAAIVRRVAPNAGIVFHRIADTDTGGTNEWVVLDALGQALSSGAAVVNLSVACLEDRNHRYRANIYRSVSRALANLAHLGTIVVASTGNHGKNPRPGMGFPARHPTVVAIGSVTSAGVASSFSRHGPKDSPPVDEWWLAPGGETGTDGTCTECLVYLGARHSTGTSFATAFASGLIARELATGAGRHQVLAGLREHAGTAQIAGYDPARHGRGILRLPGTA